MTVTNCFNRINELSKENAIPLTHFNSPQKRSEKEDSCEFSIKTRKFNLSDDLAKLADILPTFLDKKKSEEAKAELQKYVNSPLLGYLLRDMSDNSAHLLKVLAQQLFKQGMLFDAVRRVFMGDRAPDKRQYEFIQEAVYEELKNAIHENIDAQDGVPNWTLKIPHQHGGVPPSLYRLQEIVATQARGILERSYGYDEKYFATVAARTDGVGRSLYGAIHHARELLQAKIVMMLQEEKQDLLIPFSGPISSADEQVFDQRKLSILKHKVQMTDAYCLRVIKIANKCNVHISKNALAYIYGVSQDRQARRFEMLKVRDAAITSDIREVCVLELLGIWAGNEAMLRKIIVSHAGCNSMDFLAQMNQFDLQNTMIDKIVDELAECIDCSDVIRPSSSLKRVFLSSQAIRDVNLIKQQVIIILQTMTSKEIVSLLKRCPTLKEYVKNISNPPTVLSEAFRLLHELDKAISKAEEISYKKTCLYDFLSEMMLLDYEKSSDISMIGFSSFLQGLLQTLCNEKTMAFEIAKCGTFPWLAQFADKSEKEQVDLLKSIFKERETRRELEIEVIHYRDALLQYMCEAGKEYEFAEDQEKVAKRELFVEALVDILPIYPSTLINISSMTGMDDAVRNELKKKKALYSPIPKLMQLFFLSDWATAGKSESCDIQ